ncbi:UDP-4-amino-4,6-dideoxy-N-acetyl-beta-L-altrosamine transaminase [Pseudogemmobacter faecipullorum]|uniref:UDP-4-amino-4, 6-dideoxy-N-acetyl-beta-L-altrosamine transaminase n=1 Tax=Pseudogemmobacter faecipullorum TaxID=2755041 RepID=A0ABS8CRG0_9RHOB|nr:UDP-4-amino-4,6-dideoxy-N-acetyl-beta-L-altrosamine transaminase [Pseudogemmobacter faecipullorum]MCB5411982.1 UDP-4-amino-4,6-dideoxy-N-acetyl-beta-L-altrosamine transaminase [Pseudogemmobacter faecipullorum]
MIPYGKQNISEEDIAAVVKVLRSDFITQGPTLPRFERAIATHAGAAHCIAVNSATSALHIGLLALDVGPGDLVWTSPISFVASSNAALYCGADVDFVDIAPDTFNMDMQALASKLKLAKAAGCLPKVVIPVHISGRSCDMKALDMLRKSYGFKVLEDASHAIGANYDGRPVGCCDYSELCVFSFHPVKIITTGEGGALTTNDPLLAKRLAALRSHGITRDANDMERYDGPWYYEQHSLGYNYRMTEIQAALGLSQMARLDLFVQRRRELAERYDRILSNSDFILPVLDNDESRSAWHLYVVRLSEGIKPLTRLHLINKLRSDGIGVNVHYIPIPRQPFYRNLGFDPQQFPVAEGYYESAISLPLYYDMTEDEQDTIVKCLLEPAGFQTIF